MPNLIENPIQKQAIEFADGAMQVLAGPGSGKTFITIHRIKHLIEVCGVDPSNILVITFTKAAANEMKQRFYQLTDGYKPLVNFGTFHAIFYHILKQTGQYRKYTLITEMEKRKLLLQLLQLPASMLLVNHEKIDNLIRYISQLKNNGEKIDAVSQEIFSKEELLFLYQEYNQYLTEFHKLDFDDMGLLCKKMFEERSDVLAMWQEKYRYILVDEFQDINEVQYQIVKAIAGEEPNLFVVGDDDQSIYGFRGAKPDIMKQFMTDYPNAIQLTLDRNYRCHEQIVEKSLLIIDENTNRFEKAMQASHDKGDGVILHAFTSQEKEDEELLLELKKIQETVPPEQLENTAVIYRTNYECSLMAEKLLMQGIAFYMRETFRSQFDHFVIKDLLAYMEFAAGNQSRELFHLFMNRPLRYLRKDCARNNPVMLSEILDYYENNVHMQEVAYQLFDDLEHISTMKPYLAIQYIRKVIGYDDYLTETYGITAAEPLLLIADEFQKLSKSYKTFKELTDYISQSKELMEQKQKEREMEQEDGRKPIGIRLMTMHASKGLEFDTVYLPDLNEGKMPTKQSKTQAEIEEERRMFYVAMTRAKKNLHLFFCNQKTGKDIPSRFLIPILPKEK